MPRPGLLLDRDGTLIVERDYLADPAGVELLPGAAAAVRAARAAGCGVAVVSNQSGVARGKFGPEAVDAVNARMVELLAEAGATVDLILTCPHHPEGAVAAYRRACDCRKPAPGMLLEAMRRLDLDPERTLMVGDKRVDVEAARAAGVAGALVATGHGAAEGAPDAADVGEAVARWLTTGRARASAAGGGSGGRSS